MKYFVISGNYDQYIEWRKENRIRLLEDKIIEGTSDIVYVSSVHVLKGHSNPTGIFIGTWYQRADMKEVLIQLQVSINDGSKIHAIEKAWKHLESR